MSNKTQLQLNNETLASILSNVLGLPSQESLKHGAYVWKKLFKDTISFSFVKQGSPAILQATATSTDLSQVTADFFVGLKGTVGVTGATYEFITASICEVNGDSYTYTYDPTTARITVNGAMGGEIGSAEKIAFVDFTVSDDPTAYPDGGEQGGYWYEKVVEGVAGIDFGEVTLASTTTSVTVNHNLGVVPSWVALIPKILNRPSYDEIVENINGKVLYNSSYDLTLTSVNNKLTSTEITFATNGSSNYKSTSYYWFAIA